MGSVEYAERVEEEFLPLLVMGQFAHVGERAVFRLDQYHVVDP